MKVKNPRGLVSDPLFVIKRSQPDKDLAEKLSDPFYFVHDSSGVIQSVYYPKGTDAEALAMKKGEQNSRGPNSPNYCSFRNCFFVQHQFDYESS